MGSLLDALQDTPTAGGYDSTVTDKVGADLWKSFGDKLGLSSNAADPNTGANIYAPGNLETSNPSRIEESDHNSFFRNMMNSFKQGWDSTQLVTAQGKMQIGPAGIDGPAKIIDDAPGRIKDLTDQLSKGLIKQSAYDNEVSSINDAVSKAQQDMQDYQETIDTNKAEIDSEKVDPKYLWKSAMLQSLGDQGGAIDKLLYTAPNTLGSSTAFLLPTLAASFGNKLTNYLLKTAAVNVFGPEAEGLNAAVATVGTIAASVAELTYARQLETYGEVAQAQQQVQENLTSKYMQDHQLSDAKDIPEEDMRNIRIASRKGMDNQYWENMALDVLDVAGAIFMPLGNFGKGLSKLGKFTKSIDEAVETAKNYNKITKALTTVGEFGLESLKEKNEEGFQQAAQYRAQDVSNPLPNYKDNGILRNILDDGYDTFASLNYSLIPGIDLRNSNGRFAKDTNFQFSENSGGILGAIMGGIPTAISLAKDIQAYRSANKDLQDNGIQDIDGKLRRLSNSVMMKYFDNDEVHHLGEAIKSMVGKKDESGQPIISKEDAVSLVKNMKDTYDIYTSIGDRIDSIKGDKLGGIYSSGQFSAAKKMVKEDYLDAITNAQAKQEELTQLELEKDIQAAKEQQLFEDSDPVGKTLNEEFEARKASLERLAKAYREVKDPGLFGSNETYYVRLDNIRDQIRKEASEANEFLDINDKQMHAEPSPALQAIYDKITGNQMYLNDYKAKVAKLNSIKTGTDLYDYLNSNIDKPIPQGSSLRDDIDEPTFTVEDIATKIKNNQALTAEEQQFRTNNTQAVEDLLKQSVTQEAPDQDTPEEAPIPATTGNIEQDAFGDIFGNKDTTPQEKAQMLDRHMRMAYNTDITAGKDNTPGSFPAFFGGMRQIFTGNTDYIKDNFDTIQDTFKKLVPSTPTYELNSDLTLSILGDIPPAQNDEINVNNSNKDNINNYVEAVEDPKNTGDKIVSGLSLAQKNVLSVKKGYGQYTDLLENGQLQFSDQHNQQLGNTSVVSTGDDLELAIDKLPENFNKADTSDENYDKVEIGVYKTIEVAPGVSKKMLLYHLHQVSRLDELLSDTIGDKYPLDKEAEKELLRVNRRAIISGEGSFVGKVLSKGFGKLNLNSKGVTSTVANAVGKDSRVIISYVDENGDAVGLGKTVIQAGSKPGSRLSGSMMPGSTIMLLPNTTDNGLVYVPIYLIKKQLREDTEVHKLVTDAVTEFLTKGTRRSLDKAAPYVFFTGKDIHKVDIGMKGIYASAKGGKVEVHAGNSVFTPDSMSGIADAIGDTYFSVNKNNIRDPAYQEELKRSPLLQTNVTANPVLLERYEGGDYKFLKDNEQYSYFSQHTITIGSIVKSGEEVKEAELPSEATDDINAFLEGMSFDEINTEPVGKLAKLLRKADIARDELSGARNRILVSKDIPASMQHEMVRSLAFNLVSAERPDDSNAEVQGNFDRAKAWVTSTYTKFVDNRPQVRAENLDRYNTLVGNYKLMNDNIDGLLDKAKQLIESLGFRYDENTDYYENMEEAEDNAFNQFDDDSNSTWDSWDFAPKEVKKLVFFIPKMIPEIKDNKPTGNYIEERNMLGLPTFNNVQDTWEKTLEITTSMFFDATDSGFLKMLSALQNKSNSPAVQELAKKLQKAPEQVQNAFFRRTKLQKQVNISSTYEVKTKKRGGARKFVAIFQSDRKQGMKRTFSELQSEFLIANTGMLVSKKDEHTGANVLTVNTDFAKNIRTQIESILDSPGSYDPTQSRDRGKTGVVLTDTAKRQIQLLVKQIGINISYDAFKDLLTYYKTSAAGSSKDASVVREIFLQRILKRLVGEGSKSNRRESEEEGEIVYDDLRGKNPFIDEKASIDAIARQEYKQRQNTQSGSYYFDGKSYFAFTRPNYLSEFFMRMKEFKNSGIDTFIKGKLTNDTYAKRSIYLNGLLDPSIDLGLDMFYELGSRNKSSDQSSKLLKNMNPREHQVTKLAWFQNKGDWKAYFMYDTLSDKTTKPTPTARKWDISGLSYVKSDLISLPSNALERVYNAHFLNEYDRINEVLEQSKNLPKHKLIKGYHDIGKKEGMGKYFNTFYFMNRDILLAGTPGQKSLASALYTDDGVLKDIDSNLKDRIKNEINNNINKVIQKSKKDFQEQGIYNLEAIDERGKAKPDLTDLLDHNYMFSGDNSVEKRLSLDMSPGMREAAMSGDWSRVPRATLERIVDFAVADYVYNYIVFSNEMLILTGDPAQAGKLAGKSTLAAIKEHTKDNSQEEKRLSLLAHIQSTLTNLGKRNAAFLASGEGGKFKDSQYNVAIAEDIDANSEHLKYYISRFSEAANEAYGANEKMTDAQEVTTVKEFLSNMEAYGMIDNDKYVKALYIYDRDQYNKDFAKGLVAAVHPSSAERFELFNLVMQPQKPVQRTYNVDPELSISKQYYIKTSAYPLIPSLLNGAMKELLDDMKTNDIHRVAFVSGVKQGVAGSKKMFDENGQYNKEFLVENKNTLHRNGFRIQLEVPFKESKDHIREGTQQSKLLFVDIPDHIELSYRGENATAGELKARYIDYHRRIIEIQKQELFHEIGVSDVNGHITMASLKQLSNMLQREGDGRGYALNSLLGLDLTPDGQFKIPLTFLPNAGQIEPVITALLSNNITRLKMPGKSYVQGSEFALKTGHKGRIEDDSVLKDTRGIIWTKPEYNGLEKLQYLHKDDKGVIQHAQIVMPFYFIKDKKMMDVKSFTIEQDGRLFLDTSKIDSELLQMNGFRIPFQGLNSGMWFEIAGFLPKTSGDLVIVPAEIAGQMGSDYDVDKLYSYMYNYTHTEDGKVAKVDNPTPTTKEELQNALIDIQKSVYTAADEDIHKAILEPLSFDDMQRTIDDLNLGGTSEFLGGYDPLYQREVYFSNVTGKLGTAISANGNTSHAMSQGSNLFIKGQGFLFLDEKGNNYSDHIPSESSVITGADAAKIAKKRIFDKVMNAYRTNLKGKTAEYYEGEIEFARKTFDAFGWTEETKVSDRYQSFKETLELAEEFSTDRDEMYEAAVEVIDGLVTLLKSNSKEDEELITSRIKLVNDNAVNQTYQDTYEYEGTDEMVNQNDPGNNSAWRLDKVWTFPDPITGKRYRISNLISQVLGISVDNAKEQKLGALGINRLNFNVALSILRTGFSPNYMAAFINQPILKDYYTKIGETDDIYRVDYTPGKKEKAVNDIFEKYSKTFGIKEEVQNNKIFSGYKLTDMITWLNTGITSKNAKEQLYILKAFLRYKDIADGLQAVTSTFNIDAKGLPKNMSETAAKQELIANTSDSPVLGNVYNYRTTTIPGLFLEVPTIAVRIFMGGKNPRFSYNSNAYQTVRNTIMKKTGRGILTQEQVDNIHQNIKQFIYSGFVQAATNVTEERLRLLFDNPGNESLQTRLVNLRGRFPKNELFNTIKEVGSIYPDNPKLLEIPFSNEEDYTDKVSELWEQAIYNTDPDIQAFAKDMIKYALYVSPQEYGQSNIIRYIPFKYRDEIGFHQFLRTINSKMDNAEELIFFPDQFIEHNPDILVGARESNVIPGSIIRGPGDVVNAFSLPMIDPGNLKDNAAANLVRTGKNGELFYPEYLAMYNSKEFGKQIYRMGIDKTSVTYFRIEQKGIDSMSEYLYGDIAPTIVDTQKVRFIAPSTDSTGVLSIMGQSVLSIEAPKEQGEYLIPGNNAEDILQGIVRTAADIIANPASTIANRTYAKLYEWLAVQLQDLGLDQVPITLDENYPLPATTSRKNGAVSIVFNPIAITSTRRSGLSQELEKQRVILHELLHAAIFKSNTSTPGFKAIVDVWNAYKENIYKASDDKVRGIPVNVFDAELFSLLKETYDNRSDEMSNRDYMTYVSSVINDSSKLNDLLESLGQRLAKLHAQGKISKANFDLVSNISRAKELKDYIVNEFMNNMGTMTNKYYGYFDIHEFISEALTNKETQDILKKMPSIWEKLLSAIKTFLSSLFNISPNERNLMDDAFDAVFNFLKPGQKVLSSPITSDEINTQIDKLIEQGFLKIKC